MTDDTGTDAPEETLREWLPDGPFELGITAGASTPNNKIGEALIRVLQIRGIDVAPELSPLLRNQIWSADS